MAAAPVIQAAPLTMMPHLCTQPFFSSDLFPCESPQNSQLAAALLSPYATDPSLLASTERPGSSGGTGEDCFFLPEPVPLEYVGDLEPLPSYQANPAQLAQPARFSWDTADMQAMLASQFLDERPHVKREGQFEAVCSTSRSRQPGARTPQTDASSQAEKEDQPEKQEDRLESIRRTNREAQKRWRQRNKGRVKLQQQQIQTQQEELSEAKQEARQAKAELQAALQALDSLKMTQVNGYIQDSEKRRRTGQSYLQPERVLRTLGDQVRCKVDELDRLRSSPFGGTQDIYDVADDITSMLHAPGTTPPIVTTVDGKPIMQTVWPQGCSGNYWQWNDLAQQYSDMWSEKDFQSGSTSLSISGQTQQISISSIVNAPFEEFMAVKDRYIKNITTLLEQAGQEPNSPEGLRAQQLCREAVVFTFYACFLSPKRLCRASAFDYATREQSTKDDPSVWAAVMEGAAPTCEQYQGIRRLHDVFQARLGSLQKVRAKLSSQVAMLASSQRLGHQDYSRIFASIHTLNHTVALEQKLRHECTMLTCSNFTAYQVAMAMVIAYPRFLDPLAILESYMRYEPSSIRNT